MDGVDLSVLLFFLLLFGVPVIGGYLIVRETAMAYTALPVIDIVSGEKSIQEYKHYNGEGGYITGDYYYVYNTLDENLYKTNDLTVYNALKPGERHKIKIDRFWIEEIIK